MRIFSRFCEIWESGGIESFRKTGSAAKDHSGWENHLCRPALTCGGKARTRILSAFEPGKREDLASRAVPAGYGMRNAARIIEREYRFGRAQTGQLYPTRG